MIIFNIIGLKSIVSIIYTINKKIMLFIHWKQTYEVPNISYETNSSFKRSRKAKFFFLSDFVFKLIHKYSFKRILFSYMDYLFETRLTESFLYLSNTFFKKQLYLNSIKRCYSKYNNTNNINKKSIFSKLYNYFNDIIYNFKFIFGYTEKVNILNSTFDSNLYVYNFEHYWYTNKVLKPLSEDIIIKNISLYCDSSYIFIQHCLDSNMFLIYEYDDYYYFTNYYYVVDTVFNKYLFNGNYYSLHYIYYLDKSCFSIVPNEYGVYNIWLKCDISFGLVSSNIINSILEDFKEQKITLSLKKKALNSILNIKKINYNTRCPNLQNKNIKISGIKISSIQKRNYVMFGSSKIQFFKGVFSISKSSKVLISDL